MLIQIPSACATATAQKVAPSAPATERTRRSFARGVRARRFPNILFMPQTPPRQAPPGWGWGQNVIVAGGDTIERAKKGRVVGKIENLGAVDGILSSGKDQHVARMRNLPTCQLLFWSAHVIDFVCRHQRSFDLTKRAADMLQSAPALSASVTSSLMIVVVPSISETHSPVCVWFGA